jgi:hypothetical protein
MADGISRLARSVELIAASGKVLRSDKELLVLPLLSGLASLAVMAAFGLGAWHAGLIDQIPQDGDALPMTPALYVWLFCLYFAEYFVIIFFNTALVGAAIAKLAGGEVTLGSALSLAVNRIVPILGYALISATVGIILRQIAERFGFIGRLVESLFGLMWTVATFLVVPILAAEGIGPIQAIRRSAAMLGDTWGENLIGNAGISVATGLVGAVIVLVGVGGGIAAIDAHHLGLGGTMVAVGVVLMLGLILVSAALSGIYAAALYYFALTGKTPDGFDGMTMRSAFAPRGAA